MPRRPNPDLEAEILDAARKLWKKGGEKALTMRAVAKAAGTNTPSVYRRFRDRDQLLRGMLERIRLTVSGQMNSASSAEEACERYLDFALSNTHEYELLFRHGYELYHSPRARQAIGQPVSQPAREAMRRKLVERLGESPDNHEPLLTALWMVAHGTAMLLIAKSILPKDAVEARAVFTATVAALLRGAEGR